MCLHAGEQAAWGGGGTGPAACTVADTCRLSRANAQERRRAVLLRRHAGTNPAQGSSGTHVCTRGAGGLDGPLLLLSVVKAIASSPGSIRRALFGDGGWRLGCS